MSCLTAAEPFRRELSEYVTVSVEGAYEHFDPDVTERRPGRVVIAMPDFTADALAHVLSYLGRVAELLTLTGSESARKSWRAPCTRRQHRRACAARTVY